MIFKNVLLIFFSEFRMRVHQQAKQAIFHHTTGNADDTNGVGNKGTQLCWSDSFQYGMTARDDLTRVQCVHMNGEQK